MFNSIPPRDHATFESAPSIEMVRFIHDSCTDENDRVMAVTVEVLSLWQMTGNRLTPQPPGYLLVNLAESSLDPLGQLGVFNNGCGTIGAPDLAMGRTPDPVGRKINLDTMRCMMLLFQDEAKERPEQRELLLARHHKHWATSRSIAFGSGRSAPYADRWDPVMGLITDRSECITLLIHSDDDLQLFRQHVKDDPDLLVDAVGCGEQLVEVPKVVSIAGSLTPTQLDDELLAGILEKPVPVIFLPHSSIPAFEFIRNFPLGDVASTFAFVYQDSRRAPPPAAVSLPDKAFPIREYERILRRRAPYLPADYDFHLMRTIREVGPVCFQIALHVAGTKDAEFTSDLCDDLYHLTMRGLVTGVESLVYYGWGFDAGIPRSEVAKLLAIIRSTGSMTLRDVQRRFRVLDATRRDAVLTALVGQELVVVDGKQVRAIGQREFVDGIPKRFSLPPVVLKTTRFMEEIRKEQQGRVTR